MSKIAFLGLGQMGTPMATRLLDAGHDLVVWNRTSGRATPLVEPGAGLAPSPLEAAAGAEFAITMLATPEAVEEVLFGTDGLVGGLGSGQTLIEMSTIGPEAVRSLASRMPAGVAMVDAEVRGSVPEATEGRLHVFVGAPEDDFQRVRPIVELLGDVRHVGGLGAGAAMKLVVNLTLGAAIVALGEALALGQSLGLQRKAVLDVLEDSPIGPTVRAKRSNVESGQYPPSFKLRLADKDLRLVTEAGEEAGLDLKAARAIHAWLDESMEQGAGDLDFSAVVGTIAE
jgi:3-hydroxyisobutyrate dehydrogenase-like beta-hydroxyacid dehydrogenase